MRFSFFSSGGGFGVEVMHVVHAQVQSERLRVSSQERSGRRAIYIDNATVYPLKASQNEVPKVWRATSPQTWPVNGVSRGK